jgi:hypothetical protein
MRELYVEIPKGRVWDKATLTNTLHAMRGCGAEMIANRQHAGRIMSCLAAGQDGAEIDPDALAAMLPTGTEVWVEEFELD